MQFSSDRPREVFGRISADHDAHSASIARAIATGVSKTLKSRTGKEALIGQLQRKRDDSGVVYSLMINHIMSGQIEDSEKKILEMTHESIKNTLFDKSALLSMIKREL